MACLTAAAMPDPALSFRRAVPAEIEAVTALYAAAKAEPYSVWNQDYPTRADAEADLAAGKLYVLVGEDGVRGALSVVSEHECDHLPCWRITGAGVREVARVVVRADCHGRGYAALMMHRISAILRDTGALSIHISVAVSNLPAMATYPRVGFVTVGEAELFGGQYALMEKDLLTSDVM